MKFKIDENLPLELSDLLIAAGHEAQTVHQEGLRGKPDTTVIDVCRQEDRVIITLDQDFSDIRAYPPKEYPGLIVLRPHWQDKPPVLALFKREVLPRLETEPLTHRLWTVEEARLRIHDDEEE